MVRLFNLILTENHFNLGNLMIQTFIYNEFSIRKKKLGDDFFNNEKMMKLKKTNNKVNNTL